MTDDQPLSSEEMIRRARENLSQDRDDLKPDVDVGPIEEDLELEPEPVPFESVTKPRSRRRDRTGKTRPPVAPHERQPDRQTAIGLAVATILVVLGIAVLIAVAASGSG